MKKTEFQKKATAALLKRLVDVCAELGENPNIAVSSRYRSSYFKLRRNGNLIQISVRETGELSYQLTDMLGTNDGWKVYYQYRADDAFEDVIEKFVSDFSRLYMDFLKAGTLHGFYGISLSYGKDPEPELEDYERFIDECV